MEEHQVSVTQACRVVSLHRSLWYYQSTRDDSDIQEAFTKLVDKLPHRGFDTYYGRLKAQGVPWGRTGMLRVYREMKLQHRRKFKRRLPSRIKKPLVQPIGKSLCWSMDFMHDVLINGRTFRVLNILDDYNREAVAIDSAHGYPAERVIRLLERITNFRGIPRSIRVDNGPEFTSKAFATWCKEHAIEIKFIQPGKPTQNAYIERFNRLFREDILDAYLFEDLRQVKRLAEEWRIDYNKYHPHKALMGKSPLQFLKEHQGPTYTEQLE